MENISILDQIINNQKAEEISKLDAVEIIDNLFSELSERERDVLIRRYGLHSSKKETLESIGNAHNLTRERIRQIETSSIKRLGQLPNLEEYISTLKKVILQLLEEHGGLMEKEYLLDILISFSVEGLKGREKEEDIHKNYLNFLITKLLFDEFEKISNSKHFKSFYKLKFEDLAHLEEIIEELYEKIKQLEDIKKTEELLDLVRELESYNKHLEKIKTNNIVDVSRVLKTDLFEEDRDKVNDNKVVYSLLKASKKIEQNKFGHWGVYNWKNIKPKTINDKIYLVLKNHGKALHFTEIADMINNVKFDNKKANAATVHNELILDNNYVLVGRGLYGLKEWGYKKGTVADVIIDVLREAEKPLDRDAVINRVLNKREVKKATIILALMNKDKFDRVEGRYILKN